MCGCGGGGCGECTGSMVYVMEKLVSYLALTAVVTCIVATVTITLAVGVGVGYNYCYVDVKVLPEGSKTRALRTREGEIDDEPDEQTEVPSYRRSMATAPTAARRTLPLPAIKHTMAIPLQAHFDFPSLLAKLRGRNRNVTLELIT